MSDMDIDSPSDLNSSTPSDRIIQRLAREGVPVEKLDQVEPGLIAYVKDKKFRIPELVSAILPTDKEVVEAHRDDKSKSENAPVDPNLRDLFRESMSWLQWLMFEVEPWLALKDLSETSAGQRGVCGAVWGTNDIAYRCRTCENDPTCAICVPCFQSGNHKDHDYSIIYTGGGCCDCGDVTAWKREGFCSKHRGAEHIQPLSEKYASSLGPVLDALLICWRNKLLFAETISNDLNVREYAELRKVANALTFVVVETLLEFCDCSESLLSFVSKRISSSVGLLDLLVRAESFLVKDVVLKLHELLLKLLSEPIFKYEFAKVFLDYYPSVVNEVVKANSDNVLRDHPLLSTFAVQILTVPTLTPRLVKEMNLMEILLGCLGDIFVSCAGEDGRLQVTKLGNLYETALRIVEDIRFVLSHDVVPKYVTHEQRDILRTWMKLLAFVQGTNPQKRETGTYTEEETENTSLPFILGLTIAKIHLHLVDGALSVSNAEELSDETHFNTHKQDLNDEDSIRHAKVGRLSQESSACSTSGSIILASAAKGTEVRSDAVLYPLFRSPFIGLIFECLRAIEDWLGVDNNLLHVLPPNVNNTGNTSFLALKKTLSRIRRGKYILRLAGSSEVEAGNCSSPLSDSHMSVGVDNGRSTGQRSESVTSNMDNAAKLAGFDGCNLEGGSATKFDALRVFSFSDWPEINYDVSTQDVSIHIPLHRLLSLLLQKALGKCYGESASLTVDTASSANPPHWDFFGHVLRGCHPYGFSAFLMEHPLRNRVFCAQVHAGMWRRNGDSALLSCGWYRSVRWGGQDLELDLFLLQCCAALAPPDSYVDRIVRRFGLSSYFSLNLERSSEYEPVLVQEMLTLLIHIIKERRFCGLTRADSLKRELVHRLAISDATHSQLLKFLPRDLSKVDQLQEILDTVAQYSSPSGMNQGIYSLRWPYWKELDLYHPRWNSRDLQMAEERYLRFCCVSPLTTQLPKWTKTYDPLKGVARVATCRTVLLIVRSVIYYAVMTDKSTASRAPDMVLLTSLHLLALALDICFLQKHTNELSCYTGDAIPLLAFAGEEISEGMNNRSGNQSLLSLLVSLMRLHKNGDTGDYMEAGHCNLSSFIESLLKKFAEIDSGCMTKLQRLVPEVVDQLTTSIPKSAGHTMGSPSDGEKRKAKARERQAAIMEKMKAEQSRFLASIKSSSDDGLDPAVSDPEECKPDVGCIQDVCSFCHDKNSGSPVSFLILLQKSRLLSFVDRGPSSWEKVDRSDKVHLPTTTNQIIDQPARGSFSGSSETVSLSQLIKDAKNDSVNRGQSADINALLEFLRSHNGQPADINAFLCFIMNQHPAVENILESCRSNNREDGTAYSFETVEEDLYFSIRRQMHSNQNIVEDDKNILTAELGVKRSREAELLEEYIAAIPRVNSKNASKCKDGTLSEATMIPSAYDGFGPFDADGVHLSSCGHAVHQGCLDLYMSSLKERSSRRVSFEGGHIVDPDKGEFLCPVCRRLANSVLPALPGGSWKVWMQPNIPSVSSQHLAGCSTSSNEGTYSLYLQQALSLLQTASYVIGKDVKHKDLSMQRSERISSNLKSLFHVLYGMYFTGKHNEMLQSVSGHPVIIWDTLKYSLISMEIAARSGRTNLAPNYDLKALYEGLKSSNGFILSLFLRNIQHMRSKNAIHVLQRFRGIQLFKQSIGCDGSTDDFTHSVHRREAISNFLKHAEVEVRHPDTQFWKRASNPVLAHDPFSSLMWVLFCLPYPFLSCKESFLCLVHLFYAVSVTQAIITHSSKYHWKTRELHSDDCLITDICKAMEEAGIALPCLQSNYMDSSCNVKDIIRSLSFPYLRRCALLWKLVYSSISAPFCVTTAASDGLSSGINAMVDTIGCTSLELIELEKLESMFSIPPLDVVLKDEVLRPLALKWFQHFHMCFSCSPEFVLFLTPAVPFKLMHLPHVYHDLLERYIKQRCPECEPALCLLCGRLCSASLKSCCREIGCQTHAMTCGAGTGVFLLIRKTTILLQRSGRRAPWPSPYLDAFGEEDIEMHRGKPLYLNEERYAALTQMVASHGLDQSSKVLGQTTTGSFFMF